MASSRTRPSLAKLQLSPEDEPQQKSQGQSHDQGDSNRSMNPTTSFLMDKGTFVRQNVAIWATGVAMRGNETTFTVKPDDLEPRELLGQGASSYVQKAIHVPTGMTLALKVINIFDKAKRDQLIREINTLYDADCDTLVGFHGAFTREGTIVLALEYMDRGSLAGILGSHGALPEPVMAGVAFQVLWGLAYLRVEKRLHRDLKPGNVLVNSSGAVKLADFGLSAELANSIGMAQTYVGTCKYMAPERISHAGYSFPSDVWSAGLILLEGATGTFPLPEPASYIDMAVMILECPDILDVPSDAVGAGGQPLSAEFRDFISHCLRKNPEDRWPADALLGHPWLALHGIVGLDEATAVVHAYLEQTDGAAGSGAGGGEGAAGAGTSGEMQDVASYSGTGGIGAGSGYGMSMGMGMGMGAAPGGYPAGGGAGMAYRG